MLKARTVTNTAVLTAIGVPVDIGVSQSAGISIDNYSNFWLAVGTDGMFVPPHVLDWTNNFYGTSASSIQVRKGAPAGAAQATTGDGDVVIAIYDVPLVPNPGVPIIANNATILVTQNNLIGGGANTNVSIGTYKTTMFAEYIEAQINCRTAGGVGWANIRIAINGIHFTNLHRSVVIPNVICGGKLDHFNLAAALQTTFGGNTPANPGDALAIQVALADQVGVNTYDVIVSASISASDT